LIPLYCSTKQVRYKQFKKTLKGVSNKTLASRLRSWKREAESDGDLTEEEYYQCAYSIYG
jgi:DNA-binding HxlR family transcriptional regulator